MTKTNLALIGFMGVGKSSVGKMLSKKLGKEYVEVDDLIVRKAGKSIPRVFKEDGEIAFRDIEIGAIKEIALKNDLIIDCGGGVILNKINIDRLKRNAVIIWLNATPGVILKRTLRDGNGRPLLNRQNGISDIQSLIRSRKPLYEQAAEIKINTSRMAIETITDEIIGQLKKHENFH